MDKSDPLKCFKGLCKQYPSLQLALRESWGKDEDVLCHSFLHTNSNFCLTDDEFREPSDGKLEIL